MNWFRRTFKGWHNMVRSEADAAYRCPLEKQRNKDLTARMRSGILFYPIVWAVLGCGILLQTPTRSMLGLVLAVFTLEVLLTMVRFRLLLLALKPKPRHLQRAPHYNDLGVVLSSTTWSIVLVSSLLDTPLKEHFPLILTGTLALSSGALINLAIRKQTVRNFLLTMFVPTIVVALCNQSIHQQGLGLMLVLYMIALYTLSRLPRGEYERAVLSTIRLREQAQQLTELSNNDALTGLRNRRYFEQALQQECKRASRMHYPVSLLIMDIDFFKTINDRFGHMVGDQCLRHSAQLIASGFLRSQDTVARIGGEEFAVILPGMQQEEASALAENLRALISATPFHSEGNSPCTVTVSIGGSCAYDADSQSPASLMKHADQALYRSKEGGRNCLHWANAQSTKAPEPEEAKPEA